MQKIPDFTEQELWMIQTTLGERYGENIEVQLADTELRLNPALTELTLCPTAYWQYDNCHFVIFKLGSGRYNGQFYYRMYQMYGTGRNEYDDISECVVTLLQVQADHDRSEEQERDEQP